MTANAETQKRRNGLAIGDCRMALRATDFVGQAETIDVLIAPDGKVQSTSGDFTVDEESFAAMDETFREHATFLPIDYEHQTLGGDYASPDGTAPAAGWVKTIRYEKGKGVIASVAWTERARNMIRAGEYQYVTPVLIVRKADGKAIGLHSVGLTNRPAIVGMERIAAKDQILRFAQDDKQDDKLAAGQRKDRAMNELLLIGKDLGLAEADCKVETITNKIGELKKRAETPPETAKAVLVANAARKALGLKEDADADLVAASIATEKAETAGLKAMEKELSELKVQINNREAEQWVAGYSAKGVVGIGGDDVQRKADREMILRMACSNRADCERVLQQRVAVLPPGGVTKPPAGGEGAANRVQVIASARQEYAEGGMKVSTELVYVNASLREKGLKALSKTEVEELIAA